MSSRSPVEMLVAYTDKTWETRIVYVPDETPEEEVEHLAKDILLEQLEAEGYLDEDIALIALYSLFPDAPENEAEEEEDDDDG